MEKTIEQIFQVLQKLILLHRQLLEKVREEKEALVHVDVSAIEGITQTKEALTESIRNEESKRLKLVGELAIEWKIPLRSLTLSQLIIEVQGRDLKTSNQLRSAYQTLTFLVQRIQEQNRNNVHLVEGSLNRIQNMKKNVLNESAGNTKTYTSQGQSAVANAKSIMLSKEA
ncbi:MAG: flagellar protein FlgN [Deltaproteobacteria bacterium]|nr:flagellar protein FlgN [Deltaproteobacteria bacterium]